MDYLHMPANIEDSLAGLHDLDEPTLTKRESIADYKGQMVLYRVTETQDNKRSLAVIVEGFVNRERYKITQGFQVSDVSLIPNDKKEDLISFLAKKEGVSDIRISDWQV